MVSAVCGALESKGKASGPQRSRNAKGAGMLIKIQRGEEDGDAQNVPVQLRGFCLLSALLKG